MRIHHLNCGTFNPIGGPLFRNDLPGRPGRMVTHVLAIESDDGLVLIDSGYGLDDCADPVARVGRELMLVGRPTMDREETAIMQLERLGLSASDVTHIVMTHLDIDHAGGLPDFPDATVHVLETEYQAMRSPQHRLEQKRYLPAHFERVSSWQRYDAVGEPWFGFPVARPLDGLGDDFAIVPLEGHSRGHCGVAVRGDDGWILHAGDAYFYRGQLNLARPNCPPGLAFFQNIVAIDRKLRRQNEARLRELVRARSSELLVFSSHDPVEFDELAA